MTGATTILSNAEAIRDIVRESFREGQDGYFYPLESGTALVRVYVASSGYAIERRRSAQTPWLPLVVADLAEFDASAFRAWRANWPIVAD